MIFYIRNLIEKQMAKRVKNLRAGRGRSRSGREIVPTDHDMALLAYPFDDISSKLRVSVSRRARRLALRLDPKQRVMHLVVPKRASLRLAFEFAEENRDWITEKLKTLPRPVALRDGAVIPVFGRNRRIVVLYNSALKYTDIQLKKEEILVLTNKLDPAPRIKRFLMEEAKRRIEELAAEKAALLRRRIRSIAVKDTKSRWGSCSEDGEISFSWRLIFAPAKAMDYVIAHEVAHLAHMDHSPNFWRVCESICWDYDFGKQWMSDNGYDLMRFGSNA